MTDRRKNIRTIWSIVGYALVVLLIFLAVVKLPFAETFATLGRGHLHATLIAIGAFVLAMALRDLRFTLLADQSSRHERVRTAIVFPWLFMISALGPFRVGEGAKVYWLHRGEHHAMSAIGVLTAERFIDLFTLFLLGAAMLAYRLEGYAAVRLDIMLWSALALLSLTAAMIFGSLRWGKREGPASAAGDAVNWRNKLRSLLWQLNAGLGSLTNSHLLGKNIALSLIIWVLMIAGFHLFLQSHIEGLPIGASAAVLVVVNLAAVISFMPGNFGTFQLSASAVLVLFGIQLEQALTVTVLLQVVSVGTVIALGVLARMALAVHDRFFTNAETSV